MDALKNIRLLVLDFDGVMTDNRVFVDQEGREMICCSRSDGLGIERLQKTGIPVIVLSKEKNPVVLRRCEKLRISCYQGHEDKLAILKQILAERSLQPDQVCYVGNDVNDLDCIHFVGWSYAVADSHPAVLGAARSVTENKGGCGAVREVCDHIIQDGSCS